MHSDDHDTYDAFVSYAHEDAETATWLAEYLKGAWVPGKRRRRVFLDKTHLTAGGLSETLRRNLLASRFLVVCCSETAARSPWVNLEIDEFAHSRADAPGHATRAILACQAGSPESPICLPPALAWIQRELGDEIYLPDLRGSERRREAAAILAPIVGFDSREEVFAAVRKRQIVLAAAFTFVAVLVTIGVVSWSHWLTTSSGSYYAATQEVLDLAPQREITSTEILWAACSLARQNQRNKIYELARYIRDKNFHSVVIAAGLASLRSPDCVAASAQLRVLDRATAKAWPAANLLAYKACGDDWLSQIDEPDRKPYLLSAWFDRLVETGNLPQAEALLHRPDYPESDVLEGSAKLAIASRSDTQYHQSNLLHWAHGGDALDVLYRGLQLLRRFDLARRLSDPLAKQVAHICAQATSQLNVDQFSNWNLFEQLAAHLAGMGNQDDAVQLLHDGQGARRNEPGWAPGWAWRGLAFQRLGRAREGRESFDRVEPCLNTVIPASRTYNENSEAAIACALADRWPLAFRTAAVVGNDEARILQRCRLITLWVDRGGGIPWPW